MDRQPDPMPKSTTVRAIHRSLQVGAFVHAASAAKVATWFFFRTPPRRPERPEEAAVLEAGTRFQVPVDGGSLHGWTWGPDDGRLVLLAHGWGGSAAQMTPLVADLTTRGFRVAAVDTVGHGRSPGTTNSIPEVARLLTVLPDILGPIYGLVAHSLGTCAALGAIDLGLSVNRVVAIAGPAHPMRWYEAWVGGVVKGEAYERELERVAGVLDYRLEQLDCVRIASTRTEPMLWIHDVDDKEVGFDAARLVTDAWSSSQLMQTQGLGHRRILRDQSVCTAVANFLL